MHLFISYLVNSTDSLLERSRLQWLLDPKCKNTSRVQRETDEDDRIKTEGEKEEVRKRRRKSRRKRTEAVIRQTAIILLVILSDRPETRALLKPLSKDEVEGKKGVRSFSS